MTTMLEARPSTADDAMIAGHPRGRGFGILSRMARTDEPSTGRHVRLDTLQEESDSVLAFERRLPTPRHRRSDVLDALAFG